MVSSPSLWRAPVPFKDAIEQDAIAPFPKPEAPEEEDEESQRDRDRCLMSSLPVKVYRERRYLQYQATWWLESAFQGVFAIERRFRPRPSDESYPKSGTTWMKAIMFAIISRKVYPLRDHPLLRLNPHDCVVHLSGAYATGKEAVVEALPSPRTMAVHMPFSTLPTSVVGDANSGCKIVYVWRDSKDVLVSLWHYYRKLRPEEAHVSEFHGLCESFCQGDTVFGPWWDNVLGYFRASVEMPTKVLFLRYEDMLEDTASAVVAIADFVGCPFSAEEERAGVVDAIVKLCSFEELKNLDTNMSGSNGHLIKLPSSSYFRKGVAGDWMGHMTREMADRIDTIVQGKFQGSGLEIKRAST
uniref:Sulfotransferase n=1 Tax=Oryza meridionalis TaxID=40149 RepID=A0A0E0DCY3_9ORYZ